MGRHALLLSGALILGSAPGARAQERATVDTVDRIVAIVGATPILMSHVDEEIFARARGQELPAPDSPEFRAMRQDILQELVDVEVLYQQALTDTLVRVPDEQVHAAVDEQMRNVRQQYPSDQAWREDLRTSGFQSPDEYRRWLTDKQRRQLVSNAFLDLLRSTGKMKAVVPTEREMRAYYEQRRGGWKRAQALTFRQIVVAPAATPEARARALQLADSILVELRRGADFAAAARRFSDDFATRERGGSLGWFRRGLMHAAFENVAFALRPGVVSDAVETPFGYHLIQVERVQPAEISARHILLAPELRPEDLAVAQAAAEQVRAALLEGASFDSLQRAHHDGLEQRELRDFPVEQLPPLYAEALGVLAPRELTPVLRLTGPDERRAKFAVVQLLERHEEGEPRYEEVRDQIRSDLGNQLAIRRYLDRLRSAVYVEVRGT